MLSIAQLVAQHSNRGVARDQLRGEIRRLTEQVEFCRSELRELEKVENLAFHILLQHAENEQTNLGPPPE